MTIALDTVPNNRGSGMTAIPKIVFKLQFEVLKKDIKNTVGI